MEKYSLARSRYLFAFLALTLSASGGCLRNTASKVSQLQSGLVISGQLADQAGTPKKGVLVYIETAQNSAATSDDTGNFSFTLTDDDLNRMKAKVPYQREVFYLYFELSSAAGHTGAVSPFIEVVERGTLSLGTIKLGSMIRVKGTVSLMPDQGGLKPAAGATIQVGRVTGLTLADGSYALDGIAPGKVPYVVSATGYEPYVNEWDTTKVDFVQKTAQIVLFANSSVSGVLEPKPSQANLVLVTSGHPFERAFTALASQKTRFIRYSQDKSVILSEMARAQGSSTVTLGSANSLSATTGTSTVTPAASSASATSSTPVSQERAPWHLVTDEVDYDFAGSGGYILYYQFTDESQTEISSIYQIAVTIDLFGDTTGLKLNDGALSTNNPTVKVTIQVPAAAVSMRLTESLETIGNEPWLTPQAVTSWQFVPPVPTAALALTRNLYLQFIDGYKNLSPVYMASINLNLYPANETIVVGDGSGIVTEANPLITLAPPARAVSMRVSDSVDNMLKAFWMAVEPSFRFSLTSGTDTINTNVGNIISPLLTGGHTVYVQFMDDAGYISNVYSQEFTVQLFPTDGVPFLIEGGAAVVPYRTVLLAIQLPPSAAQMRIFEPTPTGLYGSYGTGASGTVGILDTSSLDTIDNSRFWIQAQPNFIYTFQTDGTKDLLLQFRDMNGNISAVYKRTIDILPFDPAPGAVDFMIGDGSGVTTNPNQLLHINVPSSAAYMAISNDPTHIPSSPDDTWQSASPIAAVYLNTAGRTVFTLRFRTVDGVMSQVAQRAIRYEPFPDPKTVVVINNGAATTYDNKINLAFNLPITAVSMRYSDDATALAAMSYGDLVVAADYILPATPGTYTIYAQMKLYDGSETPVFFSSIQLLTQFPPPATPVVVIDNGAATTTLDSVNVAINVPAAAVFMRVCECSTTDLAAMPYTQTATSLSITFTDPTVLGTKTIYAQFKAANGEESTFYFGQIEKQ